VVVVVVVVRTPTPNYLRQASQNLGKYNTVFVSVSARQRGVTQYTVQRPTGTFPGLQHAASLHAQ